MAKVHSPEVRQTDYADYYSGSKDSLIAAGICRAEWFPARLAKDVRGRTKRTYPVPSAKPETTLRHRINSEGRAYWEVEKALTDEEHTRRMKIREEENSEYDNRIKEREQMAARNREVLMPAVRHMLRRYPGLNISDAGFSDAAECPTRRQFIRFYGPLELFRKYGLVTEGMIAERNREGQGSFSGWTETGGSFRLYQSRSDVWDLSLYSDNCPRERRMKNLSDARREIKRIAAM